MKLIVNKTKEELGKESALLATKIVKDAIAKKGSARILLSTVHHSFLSLLSL